MGFEKLLNDELNFFGIEVTKLKHKDYPIESEGFEGRDKPGFNEEIHCSSLRIRTERHDWETGHSYWTIIWDEIKRNLKIPYLHDPGVEAHVVHKSSKFEEALGYHYALIKAFQEAGITTQK